MQFVTTFITAQLKSFRANTCLLRRIIYFLKLSNLASKPFKYINGIYAKENLHKATIRV